MSENEVVKAAVTGAVAAMTGAQDDQPATPIPPKSRDAHAWQKGLSPEEISNHTYSFRQQKLDTHDNPRGPQIGLPDTFHCVGENPQANLEEHKKTLAVRYGPARYFGQLKDPNGKSYQGVPLTVFTITYEQALEYGWNDNSAQPAAQQPGYPTPNPRSTPNALYSAAEEEKARASAAQEEAKRVEAETRLAETKILSERRLEEIKNRVTKTQKTTDEEEDSVAVKQLQQDLLAAKQAEAETRAAAKVAEIQAKAITDKERLEAEKKAEISRLEADKQAKLAEADRERERLATTLATKEVEHKAALTAVQSTFENRLIQQQADFNAKLLAQQSVQDAKHAELKAALESTKTQLEKKPEPHRESEVIKAITAVGVAAAPFLPTLLEAITTRITNPPKVEQPNTIEIIKQLQAQVHPPQQGLKEQLEILAKLKDLTGSDEQPDPMEALQEGLERLRAFGVDVNLGGKKDGWIDGAERIIGAVEKPIGAIVAGLAARNVNPRLQEQARRRAEAARRGRRIQGPPPAIGAEGQSAPPTPGTETPAPPRAKPPQAESSMSPKVWGRAAEALVSSIDKKDDPLIAAANFSRFFPGISGALAGPQISSIKQAQVSLRTLAGNPKLGSPASEFLMALVSRLDQPAGEAWGESFLTALKGN